MQLTSLLLGSVMIINFALAFTVIFLERKNASSTWAWLMVLFFIPVLGFILYLILGRSLSRERIFKWDKKSRLGVKQAEIGRASCREREEIRMGAGAVKKRNAGRYRRWVRTGE